MLWGLWKACAAFLGLFSFRRTASTGIHIRIPLTVGITACRALLRSMSRSPQPNVPAYRFVENLGDYLSVDELAQYLQLSRETIDHWRRENVAAWLRDRTDRR